MVNHVAGAIRLLACLCALGSAAASPEASLCVESRVMLPVLLSSSCTTNHTLDGGASLKLNVSGEQTFWLVPSGAYWDCEVGCEECFFVSVRVLPSGEAAATIGFGDGMGRNATLPDNESLGPVNETLGSGEGVRDTLHVYLDGNTTGLNITGASLSVTPPDPLNTTTATTCSGGYCNRTVLAQSSDCINLAIEGPSGGQPTLLSQWRRWGRPGRIGRWHHWPHRHYHPWHHWHYHHRYCRWHCAWGRCWNRCW